MQLLRLELKGFKSFADKTIVNFSPGMTAIVGPNGSGKSNITDAIRWVLGESNVRNLRGQKAEDIIFSGTEKRRPLGAAEATLVFDNSDKQLPDNLEEVAISRRIYRTGESEFFINKRSCRLKDIHLLLADTGLGRDSMAIIGQNRVDAILNSKPEERRLIFEDVAGISRFKINKEDAVRRIQATERNMERVQDLLAALAEQLEDLAGKAEKTRTYMAFAAEKRQYDGAMAFHNFKTAERLLTRLENEHISLVGEDTELQTQLTELEAGRQTLQLAIAKRQTDLQAWENEYSEAKQRLAELKGKQILLEEQQKTSIRTIQELKGRIEEAKANYAATQQQIQLVTKLLEDDKSSHAQKTEECESVKIAYETALEATKLKQAELQNLQSESEHRQKQQLDIVSSLERLKADISVYTSRLIELKNQGDILNTEIEEVKFEVESLQKIYTEQSSIFQSKEEEKKALQANIYELRQALQGNQKAQEQLTRDYTKAEGRLQLLLQWEEDHEGYLEPVKTVLKAKEPWHSALKGAIGDLFTAETKYLTAIDIALGGSLHYVVTTNSKAAAEAVQYLKEKQGGRVTFLPMEAIKGRRLDLPVGQEKGVIGLAVDCISFDSQYKNIFEYLLGRTLLVETLEQAMALQKKYKQQLRIVTLGGEQLNPGGSVTGGSIKRRQTSILTRREEQKKLEKLLLSTEAERKRLVALYGEKETALTKLQTQLDELENDIKLSNLEVVTAETKLRTANERFERKKRIAQETRDSLNNTESLLTTAKASEENLATELDNLTSEISESGGHTVLLQELQKLQENQQAKYEAFTGIRLFLEQLKENAKAREEQKHKYEEDLVLFTTRLKPLEESLIKEEALITDVLPKELASLLESVRAMEVNTEELRLKREEAYELGKADQLAAQTMALEGQELTKRQQIVQRRLIDMEGRLAKNRLDTETALTILSELGYTKNEAQSLGLTGSVNDWKAKIVDLQAAMAELGTINPNAVLEYEEALEKHSFLEEQQRDLELAKGHLEDVINEMDTAMAGQLKEVLGVVAERFEAIFQQLFGGGTAQIVLTQPEDILNSGIDLLIQPPGKKRQQLTLLSGGERALTVIALLFAFLDYRPAPFCVLDEVDAALDEANVDRYSRYLRTLGNNTQFIVVSHRKKTMEAAEVLQGVTMVERGISRLLTVAFEDVKEDM